MSYHHIVPAVLKSYQILLLLLFFLEGGWGGGGVKKSWIFVGFCEKVLKFCLASLNLEMFLNFIFSWKTLKSQWMSWKSPWKQFFVDFGIPFPCLAILHTATAFYEEKLRKKVIHFKSTSIADFPAVVSSMFRWLLQETMLGRCSFHACLYW